MKPQQVNILLHKMCCQVMMFSSTNCSYCDIAKETFQSMGTQFKSLEVRKDLLKEVKSNINMKLAFS